MGLLFASKTRLTYITLPSTQKIENIFCPSLIISPLFNCTVFPLPTYFILCTPSVILYLYRNRREPVIGSLTVCMDIVYIANHLFLLWINCIVSSGSLSSSLMIYSAPELLVTLGQLMETLSICTTLFSCVELSLLRAAE